jgi:hypothetical protein
MSTSLSLLSPSSKTWVYTSTRAFSATEAADIQNKITAFTAGWNSHKVELTAAGALLYNRFVVLMVDESQVGVSGCSIDSSVKFIKELGAAYHTDFFDRLYICYKNGDEIIGCNQETFSEKVSLGEITEDTLVFNNLVQTKQEWENNWLIPFGKSWMKRFFKKESLV